MTTPTPSPRAPRPLVRAPRPLEQRRELPAARRRRVEIAAVHDAVPPEKVGNRARAFVIRELAASVAAHAHGDAPIVQPPGDRARGVRHLAPPAAPRVL